MFFKKEYNMCYHEQNIYLYGSLCTGNLEENDLGGLLSC